MATDKNDRYVLTETDLRQRRNLLASAVMIITIVWFDIQICGASAWFLRSEDLSTQVAVDVLFAVCLYHSFTYALALGRTHLPKALIALAGRMGQQSRKLEKAEKEEEFQITNPGALGPPRIIVEEPPHRGTPAKKQAQRAASLSMKLVQTVGFVERNIISIYLPAGVAIAAAIATYWIHTNDQVRSCANPQADVPTAEAISVTDSDTIRINGVSAPRPPALGEGHS